jgi:hypothetical protein
MGIDQTAEVWFGFYMQTDDIIMNWARELDYDLPPGIQLVGVDSEDVVCGVQIFNSGSPRWDPMMGDRKKFNEHLAMIAYGEWAAALDEDVIDIFKEALGTQPIMFHAFVNNR